MIGLKTALQRLKAAERKPYKSYPSTGRRWLSPKKQRRTIRRARGTVRHVLSPWAKRERRQRRNRPEPSGWVKKFLSACGPDTSRRKESDDAMKNQLRGKSRRRENERRKSRPRRD